MAEEDHAVHDRQVLLVPAREGAADAARRCRSRRSISHAIHDGRMALVQRTGMMTFPQVLVGDEPLGGFEALAAADRDGRLAALLAG